MLQILGFQIPAHISLSAPQYFRSRTGKALSWSDWSRRLTPRGVHDLMLVPANNVAQLAATFPCLHTFKVMYMDTYSYVSSCSIHLDAILEASFMSTDVFPGLRCIVCCCKGLCLELQIVLPALQIVHNF